MEVGRDPACQRAFCAEAERLHVLRHAHLVQLYGVCLSGSKVRIRPARRHLPGAFLRRA